MSTGFTRRTVGYGTSSPPLSGRYLTDDVLIKHSPEGELTFLEKCAPFVCEFIGTYMLAITLGYVSAFGDSNWGPTAVGAVLMILIYAVGPVSGGNLNPAVSLALGFVGKLPWTKVFAYIILQIGGAFLAAVTMYSLFGATLVIQPNADFGPITAGFCEIFYTFLLCFVVLNCAASKRNNPTFDSNQFYALAIGLVIIAGGYPSGPISGAIFNPALAIGYSIISLASGLLYIIFHIVGACFASMMFKAVRPEDYHLDDEYAVSHYQPTDESKVLSEFIGTMVLVVTVGLNILTHSAQTGWSAGAALACAIYSLGDVSGGHFNPAVSFAVWLCGRSKLPATATFLYIIMQVMAATISGFVLSFIHDEGPYDNEVYGVHPKTGTDWVQVIISELVFTFLLCWVVLSVGTTSQAYPGNAPPPKRNFYAALAIGLCVTIGGFAVGGVSGAVLNPAVALGLQVENVAELQSTNTTKNVIAIVNATIDTGVTIPVSINVETYIPDSTNFAWYTLIQLGGALIAAILFHSSHAHEFYAKNALPA
mmetsp:Transcript_86592/g.149851  ORF Transcript_86592/g.149851 Transcript_86592/m.149851 type:complete len:537 (+) Transcript_86592:95-1705(+)